MTDFIIRPVYTDGVRERQYEYLDIVAVHEAIKAHGAVIAGGAARYMDVAGRDLTPADIDVFMLGGGDELAVAAAVLGLGYSLARTEDGTFTFWQEGHLPVQIVSNGGQEWFKKWTTPGELMSEFGFKAEMFALVDGIEPGVMTTLDAVTDAEMKQVRVQFIADPIRLAWRYGKYARKGFTMEAGEMVDIFAWFAAAPPDSKRKWLDRNLFVQSEGVAYNVDPSDYPAAAGEEVF